MDFQPVTYTVDRVIALLRAGRLALPEFQREFVWSPAKVVELLDSVSRGWPIGSLLLLRGPQPFGTKTIDAGPPLRGEVDVFVLDGQQRITALYHAIADVSDVCYYVDFDVLAEGGQDYILWKRRSHFLRLYESVEDRANNNIALISEIADNEKFFKWQSALSGELARRALSLREANLSGLRSKVYRVPVVELEHEIELEALARIFETINRTGVKLNAFDLMVAVLYPHDFNLRDEWESAVLEFPLLKAFEVDGIELLKLIAIWSRRIQQSSGGRVTVRGVRQGDVLAIPPHDVKISWRRAIESYVAALSLLTESLGVVHPSLSPPQAMVLTMAALMDVGGETTAPVEFVERWYWWNIRSQSYAQGANTRVISDVDRMSRETSIVWPIEDYKSTFLEPVRRNKILVNGLGGALAIRGALDVLTGIPLYQSESGPIVGRSINALLRGEARPDESAMVASMVFATEESFSRIAAERRKRRLLSDILNQRALDSQFVDEAAMNGDCSARAKHLYGLLSEVSYG